MPTTAIGSAPATRDAFSNCSASLSRCSALMPEILSKVVFIR